MRRFERENDELARSRLAAERAKLQKQDGEHLRAEREALEKAKAAAKPAPAPATRPRPQLQPRERRPRILMLERRRGIADAVAPKLRDLGVDVQIVERWIDAGDEIVRFRPDAIFLDAELPTFYKVHKGVVEQAPRLPIFVTAGSHGALPNVPRAASVIRPYNAEAVAKLARESMTSPQMFLERQQPQRGAPTTTTLPTALREVPIPLSPVDSAAPKTAQSTATSQSDRYEVNCSNCHVAFDATEAVSCNCLTNERTLVCTNCLTCFCKSSPSYKEKFWLEAPPRLFERKSAGFRKQQGSVPPNPGPEEVSRPLVMLVEDDEDIQTIVQRVCSNLGYGFVSATNGQEGLNLARLYKPNLILSDAFMPKLDGREMCRILKEESVIPDCKMVVMTGLYTDTKYKNEALKRFHIDDYLSKPVSITDLINLFQKFLEGDSSAPPQEDLHELHRKEVEESADEFDNERGIALAELLEAPEPCLPIAAPMPRAQLKTYEVCCFTCGKMFDAAAAEWCMCLGRDQTLLCPHCNTCFCKAPAAYKERFWMDAPSTLFERKMIGSKRSLSGKSNPSPKKVKRPLILLVEDDENIQLIVKTVVTTMGYGFIVAADGQEGLAVAREYNPDLILSDAFMPKLDGREMCRLLKEDPATARAKAIIMTGLYTDRKYRTEALTYFKVDDYVAKPVAVDDLIRLMKKHLPQRVHPAM